MKLQDDLYVVKYENSNIIYSPLRRALFFADDNSAGVINRYLNSETSDSDKDTQVWNYIMQLEGIRVNAPRMQHINKESHIVIIPTQVCNLGCTYCYAQNAHSHKNIPIKILKTTLDYILESKNKRKSISFIGGGEPLVAWDQIKWAVKYLENNKKTGDLLNIGITTNATLFTEEILEYVKAHNIHIGVSFEILPDIQNSQRPFAGGNRPTFDIVNSNIQKLIDFKIPYSIRSTITKLNVSRMPEMVEFVAKHYPNLKKLHLEQVTDSNEDYASFYNDFIKYFYHAKEIGKQHRITVYNSISKSIHTIKGSFCRGELCVTPTGSIVSCHRVSAEQEKNFSLFNYGQVGSQVVFNIEAEKAYAKHAYKIREDCAHCFARWHCAGICPMERTELSDEQIFAKCDFVKKIIARELKDTLINGLKKKKN